MELKSFAEFILSGIEGLRTSLGFWFDGAKSMIETFRLRFLDSQSADRKWNVLGEHKSILEGALDLGKQRGCQTSQASDQAPFIDGFDLFGHDLGRKRETGNPLGYDRVTGREMRRVLGQQNHDHEL